MRRLWPGWGLFWPAPFFAWVLFAALRGDLRAEHVALLVVVAVLAYATEATKKLFLGLLPFGLLGLLYDAMRLVKNVGLSPERVHVCDLRAFDARLFGWETAGGRTTPSDWLQAHSSPVLDVVCAIPYGTFLYATLGVAIWLYFRDYEGLRRFAWTWFFLNVAGFLTYHVFPAAPPWYFHAHGCAVDMTTRASEGPNLARVDAWLHTGYFAGFYGRSSDVFGAVPSLHVAYPLLNVLYGWKHWRARGRALAVSFFLLMCFSAVYLDHHWLVDVLVGIAYTLVVDAVVRRFWEPAPAERPVLVGEAQ